MAVLPTTNYCEPNGAPSDNAASERDAEMAKESITQSTPENNGNGSSPEKQLPDKIESMPPSLEAFIPEEGLPPVLDVYDDLSLQNRSVLIRREKSPREISHPSLNLNTWNKFILRNPVKFVRRYPAPRRVSIHTKGTNGDRSKASLDHPTSCHLDLRYHKCLGEGNHSIVFLAPLTLPSPENAPPMCGAVAVKLATLDEDKVLINEARIYSAFPRELQEGQGPDLPPIVPKFYGYYRASQEAFNDQCLVGEFTEAEREEIRMILRYISPLLLLEPCGQQISPLSEKEEMDVLTLFKRLHKADFTQGSPYPRNILVQPGPLTVPRADRSLDEPSYRIIDFGRGKCAHIGWETAKDVAKTIKDEWEWVRELLREF